MTTENRRLNRNDFEKDLARMAQGQDQFNDMPAFDPLSIYKSQKDELHDEYVRLMTLTGTKSFQVRRKELENRVKSNLSGFQAAVGRLTAYKVDLEALAADLDYLADGDED